MSHASSNTALLKNQVYDEINEVSYAVMGVSPEHIDDIADANYPSKENGLLQQISAAINVRLTLVDDQNFPYVYFDNFGSLSNSDKVFLYGPSGCGKSRGVLEIIRQNIRHVERVYVINPRNVVGLELGRAPLMDIVNMFSENDMVIWDNFPDDLIRRDYNNVLRVLELLSSRNVKKLVVALKPKYMEFFRGLPKEMPEFFSNEIAYGKESFKVMVKSYGSNISQFKEVYSKCVSRDLEKIANILWNKEPTPLTVLDYYNELRGKHAKNGEMPEGYKSNSHLIHQSFVGVIEAEKLLRSSNYYGHQFALLTSLQERQADVDFLYVLQMCYELGLERTETNVTNLQQAIFGSTSPKDPHNKLSNWLYMMGKQYCIHDVCRESIKLKDDIKVKMLSYVSNNFNKIIPSSSSQVNRFGLFLGRNIELLAPVSSDGILPERVYSYMKKNAPFERAIGQGAGEVFPSINDQFRKTLINNSDAEIEFGIGMAESLGLVFPLLDYDQRQLIFRKIYDSLLFARFFGQSLGRNIKDLEPDIRQEILDHTDVNPQFADGIGIGVGQVFEFLDDDLKDEINSRANVSVDITRGLGCGSALSIQSPNENHIKDVYAKAETNNEFDAGFGCGFGMLYSNLPEDLKIQVLKRCDNHIEFSYGFGLYGAYLSAEDCPEELLSMADRNVSLAIGLGLGFGIKFPYLQLEFQMFILEKSKANLMLDFGLGFGTGLIYRHLPPDLQAQFLGQGNRQNEFDMGLGFGMGWAWIYLSPENKDQAFLRCKTNHGFAYGVGIGQGYHFKYLSEGEKENVLKKADESAHYDNGLGYGLGESFLNLGEKLQNQALSRTMTNNFFAYGLSSGLGMVFSYLSPQLREDLFSRSIDNIWFARGLGFGIGRYSMSYFNEELKSKIPLETKENAEFAVGLGEGVGSSLFYHKDFHKELSGETIGRNSSNNGDNPFYRRGLGIGLGKSFVYLPQSCRKDVFRLAEKDMHFAVGLGEGIGYIFGYIDPLNQNEILAKTSSSFADSGFAMGFAMGVGANFDYLEKPIAQLLAARSKDIQFSMGLGIGMGRTCRYLSQPKVKSLYLQARNNKHFAVGLGEGIGNVFPYLSAGLMGETMAEADGNEEFATGLGIGMSISCRNNELKFREAYYSAANKNIAKGLGHGFGMSYPFLRKGLQKELEAVSEKDRLFAKEFGFSLGHAYSNLNPHNNPFEYFGGLLKKNPEFDFGLGAGLGHSFTFLNMGTQGRILSMAKEIGDFGCGFGVGLSRSFRHADAIVGQEILRQVAEVDSIFSYSLGYGLGNTFPSLNENTQKKVMGIAGRDCWFARGFAKNIVNNSRYLDGCLQGEISKLVEQNASYCSQLKDENSNGLEGMHHKIGMMENGLNYYCFPLLGLTDNGVVSRDWILETDDEVVFSGQQKICCVGFIDMMNSTKIASRLEKTQLSKYYSIFLNAMATIIKNFGGKIIKNAGDALIFYFPDTVDLSVATPKAKEVLECGVTMSAAHGIINAKMHKEGLPPVNYRTSVDYGQVEIATSKSSQNEDLFGSSMNICAKINGKAAPNGMIIGEGLFNMLGNAFDGDYVIEPAGEVGLSLAGKEKYSVYHVEGKGENTLNPFKHKIS